MIHAWVPLCEVLHKERYINPLYIFTVTFTISLHVSRDTTAALVKEKGRWQCGERAWQSHLTVVVSVTFRNLTASLINVKNFLKLINKEFRYPHRQHLAAFESNLCILCNLTLVFPFLAVKNCCVYRIRGFMYCVCCNHDGFFYCYQFFVMSLCLFLCNRFTSWSLCLHC